MPNQFYYKHKKVRGHKRHTKSGRLINVKSYERKQRYAHKTRKRKPEFIKDFRHGTEVIQNKKAVREKTMIKRIPPNMIKSMKEISKSDTEYSMMIDFEHRLKNPERAVILKGGLNETPKFRDFEMFGHSHPHSTLVVPSNQDIKIMKYLEPEFIIAGSTGQTKIFNVENQRQWEKYREKTRNRKSHSYAVTNDDIMKELKKKKWHELQPEYMKKHGVATTEMPSWARQGTLLQSRIGKDLFYSITGVKVYDVKNPTYVQMIDDKRAERSKMVPEIPRSNLEKYHNERYIHPDFH